MADVTPRVFRSASWPREWFYLSGDQRRSASVAPHSWTSEEPVAVFERWKMRKVTHHGYLVVLRLKFAGDWRTRVTQPVLDRFEAQRMAQAWARADGVQ